MTALLATRMAEADAAAVADAARVLADGGELLDERTAFQLQNMMAAVVDRGTAAAAGASL